VVAAVKKDSATIEEYERIFERYFYICNQAIEKNKDRFPYREIWNARWQKLGTDNLLHCAVYDERLKIVYTLRLTEDMKIQIVDKTPVALGDIWPFTYNYLKHVVAFPQDYIEHPANLDWGWLMGAGLFNVHYMNVIERT